MSLQVTKIALKMTAIAIAFVSVITNLLVCHIIIRVKTMKTSINYIILNLAICDAITGCLTTMSILINDYDGVLGVNLQERAYVQSPILAEALCKLDWLYWLGGTVSPLLLTIIAYERYKAIVHPLTRLHGGVSKSNLKWILLLVWVTGLCFSIVDMMVAFFDSSLKKCSMKDYNWLNSKVYSVIFLILIYIIPSSAMFMFYMRLIYTLRRQDSALGTQAIAERARRKARKKVIWVIIIVTLVFYIFAGIPHALYTIYDILDSDIALADLYNDMNMLLLTFNSVFNPFIYFFCIRAFRDGFKQVFGIKCCAGTSLGETRMNIGSQHSACFDNTVSFGEQYGASKNMKLVALNFVSTD